MKYYLIVNVILLMIFAGCALSEKKSKIIHPTPENIPTGKNGNVVNIDTSIQNGTKFEDLYSSLKGMKVLSGNEDDVINTTLFGLITDAEIDSKGRVYILDENQQHIEVFTNRGKHIMTIGGEGKGPGEFEWAQSVVIDKEKRLLVNTGYRIEIFDISSNGIEHLESKNIGIRTRSLCILGDTLYVHNSDVLNIDDATGGENIPMIHAYSIEDFTHLFSFGQSYKSENPMTIDRLSSGNIRCNEASNTVSFMYERIPVIHGYDAEKGSIKWKTHIEGLHNTQIIEEKVGGRTRLTFGPPEGGYYDTLYMETDSGGKHILVQVDRLNLSTTSFGSNREVLTFILNTETGNGAYLGDDIPMIFALSGNRVVTVDEVFSAAKIHEVKFAPTQSVQSE